MNDRTDFRPTTQKLAALVRDVSDNQLSAPTPCRDYTVADLLDHIRGAAFAFTAAATKEDLPLDRQAPEVDGSRLEEGWRDATCAQLAALADAWQDPTAYDGSTQAGPVQLPAEIAAAVALDEMTVHAWDLAVATGQSYDPDPAAIAVCQQFADTFEPPDGGEPGGELFGPRREVASDAAPLDLLLAATGRDPAWRP